MTQGINPIQNMVTNRMSAATRQIASATRQGSFGKKLGDLSAVEVGTLATKSAQSAQTQQYIQNTNTARTNFTAIAKEGIQEINGVLTQLLALANQASDPSLSDAQRAASINPSFQALKAEITAIVARTVDAADTGLLGGGNAITFATGPGAASILSFTPETLTLAGLGANNAIANAVVNAVAGTTASITALQTAQGVAAAAAVRVNLEDQNAQDMGSHLTDLLAELNTSINAIMGPNPSDASAQLGVLRRAMGILGASLSLYLGVLDKQADQAERMIG